MTVFIIAVVLAGVIGGWWLSRAPEMVHQAVRVKLAYALPQDPTTGCAACHTTAIAYTDCMQCHTPTINYIKPDVPKDLYMGHHDLTSGAIIPPATTVLESCIDASCHNASATDARYVVHPVAFTSKKEGHPYCREQCHTDVTCDFCHK